MHDQIDQVLARLKSLSPMPNDDDVTAEQLDEYQRITEELWDVDDPRIIQAVVDSFGYVDGYGLYQSAMHMLDKFGDEQIVPILQAALKDGTPGSQMWSLAAMQRRRVRTALPLFVDLLASPNEFVRAKAVSTLGFLGDDLPKILELQNDPSLEVRAAVNYAIKLQQEMSRTRD